MCCLGVVCRQNVNKRLWVDLTSEKIVKLKESENCTQAVRDCNRVVSPSIMMPHECVYRYNYFIIVDFIIFWQNLFSKRKG